MVLEKWAGIATTESNSGGSSVSSSGTGSSSGGSSVSSSGSGSGSSLVFITCQHATAFRARYCFTNSVCPNV